MTPDVPTGTRIPVNRWIQLGAGIICMVAAIVVLRIGRRALPIGVAAAAQ